jgi:chromosome segregation ATPase
VNRQQRRLADYAVMVQARQRRARVLQAELRENEAAHRQAVAGAQQVQHELQQARQALHDYHERLALRTAQARAVRVEDLLGARAHCERLQAQAEAVQARLQVAQDQVQHAAEQCAAVRRRMLANEERMRSLGEQRQTALQQLLREAMDREEEEHTDTQRPGGCGRLAWTA